MTTGEAISTCEDEISKNYGITSCGYPQDYWAGAMKKCHDIGMHLPSLQTLANIAGSMYGRTDIGPYTSIMRDDYTNGSYPTSTGDCRDFYSAASNYRLTEGNVICTPAGSSIPMPNTSALKSLSTGYFWSAQEYPESQAYTRLIYANQSSWGRYCRNVPSYVPLCVGD